ncbi:hypothetical protein [Paenibacillus harenae]|uniref:hypothetical protein n=1 Tax=Paenibacillus harenae TaxID=306543 RepID=UPI000429308C|nr:hypothetical protein [Paenibacillus harenae]
MPEDSLHAKQLKWRPASEAANLQEEPADEDGRSRSDGANREWQRFYEVIKEITDDMRR